MSAPENNCRVQYRLPWRFPTNCACDQAIQTLAASTLVRDPVIHWGEHQLEIGAASSLELREFLKCLQNVRNPDVCGWRLNLRVKVK